jgi:hypothetical protein
MSNTLEQKRPDARGRYPLGDDAAYCCGTELLIDGCYSLQ